MQEGLFIYKKEVDWSLLHQGMSVPVSIQVALKQLIKDELPRGATKNIKIIFDNNVYPAKLINQKFDEEKYPSHGDIIQIRYEPNHEISKRLRFRFHEIFNYLTKHRININKQKPKAYVSIPEDMKQYVILYSTTCTDCFLLDYITSVDSKNIRESIGLLTEEEFEISSNSSKDDFDANIYMKSKLVKVRKLDRSICDNLKLLYNYRCQISGEKLGEKYDGIISEAHHIDYFIKSLNNNSNNIVIISPNFHRIIHKTNPAFDRNELAFVFPNGIKEKLKLNFHLKT